MSDRYGQRLLRAMDRARTVAAGDPQRQEWIIDDTLAGLTVPQLRALYVAHFSGQPLPRALTRPGVVAAVRAAALARLTTPAAPAATA
jgi:hypothetical protein